ELERPRGRPRRRRERRARRGAHEAVARHIEDPCVRPVRRSLDDPGLGQRRSRLRHCPARGRGRALGMTSGPAWWQRGAIYQIYPRSFADSDGDGVGDLPGITSRLEHLAELGAEAIWLSPFYRSPMAAFGYDVADYLDVDPAFGTLDDFDRLLEEAHARRIRVVVDWV